MACNVLHGTKRLATDSLVDDQPLAKRFTGLRIESTCESETSTTSQAVQNVDLSNHANTDLMDVDETKQKVFIRDIFEEIQDIENSEKQISLLPDIDKKLSSIPKALLHTSSLNNQLVPYEIPSSLSLPEQEDSVRKAIIEMHERARKN